MVQSNNGLLPTNVEQTFNMPEDEDEDICVGDFDEFMVRMREVVCPCLNNQSVPLGWVAGGG